MDILGTLKISSSAMAAQRTRLNIVSANLANIETTRTPEGGPYRKQDVVFRSVAPAFARDLDKAIQGVEVAEIRENPTPPPQLYDPTHPDANGEGYVLLPNVNLLEEMADMMSASRAYEANVTVVKSAKRMALKALDIGR